MPCLSADRIPLSVSGNTHSEAEMGEGDGYGVRTWIGGSVESANAMSAPESWYPAYEVKREREEGTRRNGMGANLQVS